MLKTRKRSMRRRHAVRRRPRTSPKNGRAPALPPPVEDTREARMRLDTNERRILVAGLLQLLPPAVRENRQKWHDLSYEEKSRLQPVRALLARLRAARVGHPSTWGF